MPVQVHFAINNEKIKLISQMSNQKGLVKLFTDIIINLNILNKRLFIYFRGQYVFFILVFTEDKYN